MPFFRHFFAVLVCLLSGALHATTCVPPTCASPLFIEQIADQ